MWFLLSGIYLGWALGANDAANVFGTGVTSGLVSYKLAVILTAIFVILGAVMEGTKPMDTVGYFTSLTLFTALLVTLSAAITVTLMTRLKLPVSTSQAILGAIVGIAIVGEGWRGLPMDKLTKVVLCWIFTPLGAAVISFLLFMGLGYLVNRIRGLAVFTHLMRIGILVTGCFSAYALGSNNVANTTGAFVGAGLITPIEGALIGSISIGVGALTYSRGVMISVGRRISLLDPFSALVVVLAGAITVYLYTQIGVPVSTSQAVVGAVAAIGLAKGIRTINKKMLFFILLGWISTPILAASLSILMLLLFSGII
ncbi:anion permease [Candidatus Aerophobetes bacterium Ae_b3b]|nr:MAG: anion permease [Candidatus Aerophobetes bacterium Ae_b3b]